MNYLLEFAERLTELMRYKSIKSEQLAKELSVSGSIVRSWQRGEKQPSLPNLTKLADFFNSTMDFLAGRNEGEMDFVPQIPPPFPQALRKALAAHNMSRYSLTSNTKFGDGYVYKWDKGAQPDMITLIELANILGCSIDYLVGREN